MPVVSLEWKVNFDVQVNSISVHFLRKRDCEHKFYTNPNLNFLSLDKTVKQI